MPPAFTFGEPDLVSDDPGLFGPGSQTWRVHADPASSLGGVRALLLQALQPESMAGVAAHSDFRADPWGRLFRTAEYIGVISFGTGNEAHRAAGRVRGIHRKLRLDDPRLLLWVHCGFVDSMLSTYQRAVGMSAADADGYVREQLIAAELVGIPDGMAPASVTELRTYYDEQRASGDLFASAEAVEAARFVVVPPMQARVRWLTPAQGLWAGLASTGFALMPRWARGMYGAGAAPGVPGASAVLGLTTAGVPGVTDFQATLSARAWRTAFLALPGSIRKGPHVLAAETRLGISAA